MKPIAHRILPALLALLATTFVHAQEGGGRPPSSRGGGEFAGARPPEGATQEEKRAFYQKRAAERAKAEEASGAAPAGGKPAESMPTSGRPPEGASQEEKRAFYQKRAAERAKAEAAEGKASAAPAAEHRHGSAPEKHSSAVAPVPAVKPGESTRGNNRPGGMGMRGGNGAIWLSDSPPSRGDGQPRSGMGGMGMGSGQRSGPPTKRLWLRAGSDPVKSGFAREDADAPAEMLLVKPQGSLAGEPLAPPEDGKKNLSFEMPAQGYYRVYVTTRKVLGETLSINVAKAEISNFSHGGDEEERAQGMLAPRVLESAPIEIVREKAPNEPTFFQLKSGEEQAFIVLQKGLPVLGARVRFVSHEGWSKEAVSDEQGRVSFQIIRDYFPPWDDFKKRFKATYLLIADVTTAEKGVHKDQPYSNVRYQTTLSGSYYPSPDDYRSYAWGLGVGLLIVLFCGAAVYLFRRRRVKPFQEVRFDDNK